MINITNEILEDAKVAYKESVLTNNDTLEERLLSIIGNAKLLLHELQKTTHTSAPKEINENEVQSNAIAKVKKRVPLWLTRPHQRNYKILVTYMELSENDSYPILLSLLESNSGLDSREFISHYNQMKSFADKAHGKIFEEENGQIRLWKPISEFIINLFQEQDIYKKEENMMDKRKASELINSSLNNNELNPRNGGNIKFSNINKSKNVFWINVHLNRVSDKLHFILNNNNKREFIHLSIPENTLNPNLFLVREDLTNGLDKIDIEISLEPSTFLQDIKSNGTNFDFSKYVSSKYTY